ncbi:hypothetical protein ABL78_1593 [Leptomonas seymouri]|uniref:Uncharacterized protein n=1 Tax=Leptomonas seymouri TaxID=5684 RepID=A0A0N1I8M2_LEPSE|nr:hypothetical protein ABL78_1593 [Leptomonas seymouri]|eukprot:KPI89260.1 hypothetical protein ABL78_1593 [Leptomonas seymouri]
MWTPRFQRKEEGYRGRWAHGTFHHPNYKVNYNKMAANGAGSMSAEAFAEEVGYASTSAAAVAAVQRAVEAPAVFFYGALLSALHAYTLRPHAPKLGESLENWIGVVELLTFKTLRDVDASAAGVKAIVVQHPVITEKLRLLTLLTLCSQQNMTTGGICMSYETIGPAVGRKGSVEVQKVVLAAVQHKLCVARLNEQTATVRISAYESRAVDASEVAALKERVVGWIRYAKQHLRES